ncbi:MAG: type II toxin-antitoxin system VapC family toxin [Patescibacteria group bacterium]
MYFTSFPIVLDSSVLLKWISKEQEDLLEKSSKLFDLLIEDKIRVFSPELAKYEVGNVLVSKIRRGFISYERAYLALEIFFKLPIVFVAENAQQSQKTLKITKKTKMTYYDASFVSLAEELETKLVTNNYKHQGKFKGVEVIALKDYK